MLTAILLLGSNFGDRKAFLENAIDQLEQKTGKIISTSSIYETAAWGVENQQNYLNQVVVLQTEFYPFGLLKSILEIEKEMGRTSKGDYQPRTLDIDILFYENLRLQSENLIIPHPRLHLRKFTLIPLNELLPDFIHPEFKKSTQELLKTCEDTLEVTKLHAKE